MFLPQCLYSICNDSTLNNSPGERVCVFPNALITTSVNECVSESLMELFKNVHEALMDSFEFDQNTQGVICQCECIQIKLEISLKHE